VVVIKSIFEFMFANANILMDYRYITISLGNIGNFRFSSSNVPSICWLVVRKVLVKEWTFSSKISEILGWM